MEKHLKKHGNGINASVKRKGSSYLFQTTPKILTHITKSLDDFLEISDIRNLVQLFVEEENKLFNRRITKFVKVFEQHKLQDLRNHMLITEPLSSEIKAL